MQVVRRYEENAEESSWRALIKDAKKYAQELGLELNPIPVGETDEVNGALIGECAKEKLKKKWMEEVKSENWQRNC